MSIAEMPRICAPPMPNLAHESYARCQCPAMSRASPADELLRGVVVDVCGDRLGHVEGVAVADEPAGVNPHAEHRAQRGLAAEDDRRDLVNLYVPLRPVGAKYGNGGSDGASNG